MIEGTNNGDVVRDYIAENHPDVLREKVGEAVEFAAEYAMGVLSRMVLPERFPSREMQMAIVQAILAAFDQPAFADLGERYRRALVWGVRPEVAPEICFMLGSGIVSRPSTPENVRALRTLVRTPEYAAFEKRYSPTLLEIFYAQIPTDRALLA